MVSGWSDGDVRPRGYVESHGGHFLSVSPTYVAIHTLDSSTCSPSREAGQCGTGDLDFVRGAGWRVRRTEVACSPDSKVNAVHWGAQAGAPTALPPHGPTYNLHNPLVQRMQSLGFAQSA